MFKKQTLIGVYYIVKVQLTQNSLSNTLAGINFILQNVYQIRKY